MAINKDLAYQRGLTEMEQAAISLSHDKLQHILDFPEEYTNPVALIEEYEYALQVLWKFEANSHYHSYWTRIKGCSCPYFDNRERFGTGFRIINTKCKWHGDEKLLDEGGHTL